MRARIFTWTPKIQNASWTSSVRSAGPNLSAGMRQINGRYTQVFNRRHQREGHLFQGRYMAILVDREAYLKEVCRYVVLNPVRAGLTTDVRSWRWSSYGATLRGGGPAWLATRRLLDLFGGSPRAAAGAFAAFVAEGAGSAGQGAGLWDNLKGQIYLGSAGFVEAMRSRAGARRDSAEVPRAQRQSAAPSLGAFVERYADRHEAMARAYLEGGYSQAKVARHFGVHYSTVSRAVLRLERALDR
jgi:hypothetical protein